MAGDSIWDVHCLLKASPKTPGLSRFPWRYLISAAGHCSDNTLEFIYSNLNVTIENGYDPSPRISRSEGPLALRQVVRRAECPGSSEGRIGTLFADGNFSNVKGVGGSVFEKKIDFGPGYRIYFGKDGDTVIILLGGSSKQRQQQAIEAAKERWVDYRTRRGT